MADPDELERLLRLLREQPALRAELRRLLADEDGGLGRDAIAEHLAALAQAQARTEERLAALTERVDLLAAAQTRTEQRLEALTERVDALAAAQTRTEQRLEALTERVDALTERVDALAAAQTRTEQRLEALTERVDALTERVDTLTERVNSLAETVGQLADHTAWLTDEVGQLRGDMIERRYRERAHAYLSALARRIRLLPLDELDDLLDGATDRQAISKEQADQVRMADAVLHGVRHGEPVVIVLEASGVADVSDVQRAYERAGILGEAGRPALAVAAGERFTAGARERASALGVWQVVDGRVAEPPAQP